MTNVIFDRVSTLLEVVSIFPIPTIPKRTTRKQAKRMMPSSMLCSTTLPVVK